MEKGFSEDKPSSSPSWILVDLLFRFSRSCDQGSSVHKTEYNFLQILGLYASLLLYKFVSGVQNLWRSQETKVQYSALCSSSSQQCCRSSTNKTKDDDAHDRNLNLVSRGEVEMVMERIGIFCSKESFADDDHEGLIKESLGSDELSKLFDDKEPSLEEVKEAFDVFDVNTDGFIDAEELQGVLRKLGMKEGFEVENCRRMINKFDENGDGRIDFSEFVRFMECSFC